jgi:hypothetical protein
MRDFPHGRCAVFGLARPRPRRHDQRVAEPARDRELSSAIAAAIDDICQDLARYRARQEQRLHLTRCIAAADALIEDLRELRLAGSQIVPADWQPRLEEFSALLPPGLAAGVRPGAEASLALDRVFHIEERLFRIKLDEWAGEGAVRSD